MGIPPCSGTRRPDVVPGGTTSCWLLSLAGCLPLLYVIDIASGATGVVDLALFLLTILDLAFLDPLVALVIDFALFHILIGDRVVAELELVDLRLDEIGVADRVPEIAIEIDVRPIDRGVVRGPLPRRRTSPAATTARA